MRLLPPYLALLGCLQFHVPPARAVESAEESSWRTGLDLSVDAAAGLRGGAARGESVHGSALGYFEGSRPVADGRYRLTAFGSVLALQGRGPTGKYLGDYLAASNSEGFESVRFYAWWAEFATATLSVRAGTLLADEEFAGTEAGGVLINSAFGWPAFISGNTVNTGPAFYAAAPGVRVEWRPTASISWKTGLYDGDSFDSAEGDPAVNRDGLHLHVGGRQGLFLITQLTYAPENQPWRTQAGAWWHTGDFPDFLRDQSGRPLAETGGDPRLHEGNGGVFAAIERTWGGEAGGRGTVDTHIRFGVSPENRSTVAWAVDVAAAWRGPLASRPDDVVGLGWIESRFSGDAADAAGKASPTDPRLDYERVVELSYTWVVNERLSVQPDVQWAQHPGGSAAWRDSLLVMVRLNASF